MDEQHENSEGDLEQNNLLEVTPKLKRKQNTITRNVLLILMTMCFYPKKEEFKEGPMPGLTKVLGAPLSYSKRKALMFTPNLAKYSKLDNSTIQNVVQWVLMLE